MTPQELDELEELLEQVVRTYFPEVVAKLDADDRDSLSDEQFLRTD